MGDEQTNSADDLDVPIQAVQSVDPAVATCLPSGTVMTSIASHGASFWTRTARLDGKQDGTPVSYFLKVAFGERGRSMMSSEYHCMSKIYDVKPDLVPRPLAWGTYSGIPEVHFLLCEFRAMTGGLPDIETFPAAMADVHRAGTSPGGRFGFDVTTFHGNIPIEHGWSDTWEEYFTRTTRILLEMEQEAQGPNKVIKELMVPFFNKVLPRLLRPLETEGRSIKPALIHGDLWHGNALTDLKSNKPIIFDAASFYAHNEYELAVWRQPWNEIKLPYRMRYYQHHPRSQPEDDFDDRNALYAIRVNILDSILYKDDTDYRDMLISGMRELVDKFPGGFEEWQNTQKDAEMPPHRDC
ncbi:Fructosamine kinase-domain-containing protein [Xylariaceae sp. FL0016]|nr:Fructosamine kinase-domain-containing protein [Xylariaceae sp. FL0016]